MPYGERVTDLAFLPDDIEGLFSSTVNTTRGQASYFLERLSDGRFFLGGRGIFKRLAPDQLAAFVRAREATGSPVAVQRDNGATYTSWVDQAGAMAGAVHGQVLGLGASYSTATAASPAAAPSGRLLLVGAAALALIVLWRS